MAPALQGVTVACRIRPLLPSEESGNVVVQPDQVSVNAPQGERTFAFDHAFDADATDDSIWTKLQLGQLTEKVLSGYHATVMAYGQTGSGKTYTIDGATDNDGVVYRAANLMFEQMQTREERFTVKVSYMQLYLEKTFDLLNPAPWLLKTKSDKNRCEHLQKQCGLRLRAQAGGWYVENLFETECANADEIMQHWHYGRESKQMAQTAMNAHSSRSHTMFTIKVERLDPQNEKLGPISVSKMIIVDLAGSERPNITSSTRFAESVNINGSLFVLRKVISALVQNSIHVPYRESKLTCLLKQSIGGSSYLVMLACINPTQNSQEETISTLHYASQAARIQNAPRANKDPKLELIEYLRAQVAHLEKYITDTLGESLPESIPEPSIRRCRSAHAIRRRTKQKPYTESHHNHLCQTIGPAAAQLYAQNIQSTNKWGIVPPTTKTLEQVLGGNTPPTGSTTPRKIAADQSTAEGSGDGMDGDGSTPREKIYPKDNRRTSSVPCIRRINGNRPRLKADEAGSKVAEFIAKTSLPGPIGGVRALARWFHEQQKEVLYGPPRRKPNRGAVNAQVAHAVGLGGIVREPSPKVKRQPCPTFQPSHQQNNDLGQETPTTKDSDDNHVDPVAEKGEHIKTPTAWGDNHGSDHDLLLLAAQQTKNNGLPNIENEDGRGSRSHLSISTSSPDLESSGVELPPGGRTGRSISKRSAPARNTNQGNEEGWYNWPGKEEMSQSRQETPSGTVSGRSMAGATPKQRGLTHQQQQALADRAGLPKPRNPPIGVNTSLAVPLRQQRGRGNADEGTGRRRTNSGQRGEVKSRTPQTPKDEEISLTGPEEITKDLEEEAEENKEHIALLLEENDILLSKTEMYQEQIQEQQEQVEMLQDTLKDFEDATQQQQRVQAEIRDQLQTAYQSIEDEKREMEKQLTRKIKLMEQKLRERDQKMHNEEDKINILQQKLKAAEAVAVSNLQNYENDPKKDIKKILQDILSEVSQRNIVNDNSAQELRKEVSVLKKKRGVLLSMLGKVEAMKIKEDVSALLEERSQAPLEDVSQMSHDFT